MSSNVRNAFAFFQNRVNQSSQLKQEPFKRPPETKKVQPTNANFLKAKEKMQNYANGIIEPKQDVEKKSHEKISIPPNKNFIDAKMFFQNIGKSMQEFKPKKRDYHIGTENIRNAFKFFQSRVVINSSIQKAPEHIKKEAKKIEEILQKNEIVQNNEIFIEIVYEDDQKQNDNENKNSINNNTNNNNNPNLPNFEQEPPPPPSKVLKQLPTQSQICLIKNTENIAPKMSTAESLIPNIAKKEDAEKVSRFNNFVIESFKKENIIHDLQPQNNVDANIDLSHFRSNRKRRSKRV